MTEPLRLTIVIDRIRAIRDRQDQLVAARLALRSPDTEDGAAQVPNPDLEK